MLAVPTSDTPPPGSEGPLRILLVEDADDDAQLALHEIRLAGVVCVGARVQTERELVEALHAFAPDVVLSDHSLPQFTAQDALRTVQRIRPETPVIVVTGSLDEETAAAYIKSGAADYIVKHRLHRLGPAVRRAVALRRAQQEAVEAAQAKARSEQRFRKLVEFSSDVITLLDASGAILYSSQSINPTLGYEHGELTGHRGSSWSTKRIARGPNSCFATSRAGPARDGRTSACGTKAGRGASSKSSEPTI